MANSSTIRGVVRGNSIELERPPGLPDGQEVTVTLRTAAAPSFAGLGEEARRRFEEAWAQVKDLPPGEGLRRAAGAWAEDAEEVDRMIEEIYELRRHDRPPLEL